MEKLLLRKLDEIEGDDVTFLLDAVLKG